MGRKNSLVWNYFQKFRKDANLHGKCKFCGQTYVSNASRMERHLSKYCTKVSKNVREIFSNCNISTQNFEIPTSAECIGTQDEVMVSQDNQLNAQPCTSKSKTKSNLRGFIDGITKQENNKLNTLLARAIFATATPNLFVENAHVKKFLAHLRPSYELPSRFVLSTTLLNKEYDLIRKLIQDKIKNTKTLALLSDGWTDINGISLINIIFTTPEPVFYRAIDSKSQSHTGDYIATVLGQAMDEVGSLKVGAIITDNAPNMKNAWIILKAKYPHVIVYGCIAHGLNLLSKDILLLPTVSHISSQVKDIIKFFRNKHAPRHILKELQLASVNKEIQLLTYSETRWGSISNSFESLLKNKDFIQNAIFTQHVKQALNNNSYLKKIILDEDCFWQKVVNIFNLIKPIAEAIKQVECDSPCLSSLTKIVKGLQNAVNNSSKFLSKSEQTKLETYVNKRFSEFIINPVQLAANLLNPKEKGNELTEDEQNVAIDFITDFAEKYSFDVEKVILDLANYRAQNDVWAREKIWKLNSDMKPLTWWMAFFPCRKITKVAIKILSFPATAASSERNWKAYSQIHTKKRNKLTVERAMKLVYIKFNLELFKNENIDELAADLNEESYSKSAEINSESTSEIELSDTEEENETYIQFEEDDGCEEIEEKYDSDEYELNEVDANNEQFVSENTKTQEEGEVYGDIAECEEVETGNTGTQIATNRIQKIVYLSTPGKVILLNSLKN